MQNTPADAYLAFAHEPYLDGANEVNLTLVAAESLLHPEVLQPDGARIYKVLTHQRSPGEVVPLSTLTSELDDWSTVGDWEQVTTDLLRLGRQQEFDSMQFGLPPLSLALICRGPEGVVKLITPDGESSYGPADRAEVLAMLTANLSDFLAEGPMSPGHGLLHPPQQK